MDVEYRCKQALYYSVRKSKVLQMQPSDGAYAIICESYMSAKFAQRISVVSDSY